MSKLEVDAIEPQSGTTLTLGASGDTVTIPSGVTLSGTTLSGTSLALTGNIGIGGATPTISGTGITFPATESASTNANTLDDYEEGTFTPGFTGSTTAPSGVNYFSRNGYYIKIGRQVSVSMWLDLQSWSSAPTGTAAIGGLPFTSSNVTNGYHAFTVGYSAGFNTDNAPQAVFVGANQSILTLSKNATSDSRNNLLTGVVSASMNGTESIIVSGTYFTG